MALAYLSADDEDEYPTLETDPRSSDFMKIKIGETRIDPLAGLQQVMVFSSRIATGETKSISGKVKSLTGGKGPYAQTRWDVTGRFLRTKLGPIPGAYVTTQDDMTDVVGRKHTMASLGGQLFLPLSIREVSESMKAQGYAKGTAISILALLGMGCGTYGPRTEYLAATPEERKGLFEKALKRIKWNDEPLAYSDQLTPYQLHEVDKAKQMHAGRKVYSLTSNDPEDQAKAREELAGISSTEAMIAFRAYWKNRGYNTERYSKSGELTAYGKRIRLLRRRLSD
jgi:hypothetical protein